MAGPTSAFWQDKFDSGVTPWDRGGPGPQLLAWYTQGVLANSPAQPTRVLVPGCGSGHDVAWLAAHGFQVLGFDYAEAAVSRTREKLRALMTSQPPAHLVVAEVLEADALKWDPELPFDVVYEQACLCALYPDHWLRYAEQLHRWLRPEGTLLALFAQVPRPGSTQGLIEGPPYHCDVNAMRALFPAERWDWPRPPYSRVPHPAGMAELAVVLRRR